MINFEMGFEGPDGRAGTDDEIMAEFRRDARGVYLQQRVTRSPAPG
jgi:hypothetical protein